MKNKIINWLKDYFTFNKSERAGALILVLLIMIVLLLPYIIPHKEAKTTEMDFLYQIETEQFLQNVKRQADSIALASAVRTSKYNKTETYHPTSGSHENTGAARFKPFTFDPNTVTGSDLVNMGFSEKQAKVILNYKNKGGKFYKKEDFNKLYVVDDDVYGIFEPYIVISGGDKNKTANNNAVQKSTEGIVSVELNTADSLELLKINGVGSVFASRILRYRSRLGGFFRKEQLMEVWGIDSSRFSGIAHQVRVDTAHISKLHINKISLAELKKHPYFNYSLAKLIIDKRIQSGGFKSIADFENAVKSKVVIDKLRGYIDLD